MPAYLIWLEDVDSCKDLVAVDAPSKFAAKEITKALYEEGQDEEWEFDDFWDITGVEEVTSNPYHVTIYD